MESPEMSMRIAGRDYIFKLMSPEFVESLFDVRRRYFLGGMPSEIGKNKTAFFVAKFKKSQIFNEYTLVGEGTIKDVTKVIPLDKDYTFASGNGWPYVIDFESLTRYEESVRASLVFSDAILKKLNGQRPFGVELAEKESKVARQKLEDILSGKT